MLKLSEKAWVNGQVVGSGSASPSIASHTLHYGVGIFDGIMAYWNRDHFYIHCAEAHISRFLASCRNLGFAVHWPSAEIESAIDLLLDELTPDNYYIRPLAYHAEPQIPLTGEVDRGPADLAILTMAVGRDNATPLKCQISPYERVSSRAIPVAWKLCSAYANSYLARRQAELAGFDDGIMLDRTGRVCEASAANIFFMRDGVLETPKLTPDIFPGITRALILKIARENRLRVHERDILASELHSFDGSFLASTLMEIKPISWIDDHQYSTLDIQEFSTILNSFRELTHK